MPSQVSGSDIVVALYDEAEYGVTPDTPAGRAVCFSSFNLQPNEELLTDDTICASNGRGVPRPGRGGVAPGGSVRVAVAPEHVGFWLRHLLGEPVTTGAGPYTHVFTPGDLPVGFIAEKDYTAKIASKVERFTGLKIDGATFSFPAKGYVTADYTLMGKGHLIASAPLDASLDAVPGHTPFSNAHLTVQEGGSDLCQAVSGSLSIANNLDGDNYTLCSGGTRYAIGAGEVAISGSLDLVFESFDQLDKAYAATETTVRFAATNGANSLTFLVNHADLTRMSPPIETKRGINITLSFTGFASGADVGLLATLVNSVAGADL